MDRNLIWIIGLIVFLIFLDKILTFASIKAMEKNFPTIDKFSIEKNPIQRWFFQKVGLGWGLVLYGIISIITFYIAWILINITLTWFRLSNSPTIGLYILFMVYGLVITNNLFQLLRYSKIIP